MKILSVPYNQTFEYDKLYKMKLHFNPERITRTFTKLYSPDELQRLASIYGFNTRKKSNMLTGITLLKLNIDSRNQHEFKLLKFSENTNKTFVLMKRRECNPSMRDSIQSRNFESNKLPSVIKEQEFFLDRTITCGTLNMENHKEKASFENSKCTVSKIPCQIEKLKKYDTIQRDILEHTGKIRTVHTNKIPNIMEEDKNVSTENRTCGIFPTKSEEKKQNEARKISHSALISPISEEEFSLETIPLDHYLQNSTDSLQNVEVTRASESLVSDFTGVLGKSRCPKIRTTTTQRTTSAPGLVRTAEIILDAPSMLEHSDSTSNFDDFDKRLAALDRTSIRIEQEFKRNTEVLQRFLELQSLGKSQKTEGMPNDEADIKGIKAEVSSSSQLSLSNLSQVRDISSSSQLVVGNHDESVLTSSSIEDFILSSKKTVSNSENDVPVSSHILNKHIHIKPYAEKESKATKPFLDLPPKPPTKISSTNVEVRNRLSMAEKEAPSESTPKRLKANYTGKTARRNLQLEMAERRRLEAIDYANSILAEISERNPELEDILISNGTEKNIYTSSGSVKETFDFGHKKMPKSRNGHSFKAATSSKKYFAVSNPKSSIPRKVYRKGK